MSAAAFTQHAMRNTFMTKTQQPPVHIVWFKRNLRVHDHAALFHAAGQEAPVLPLYVVEPSLLNAPDFDPAHWTFIQSCLEALRQNLAGLGQPLVVRIGEAVQTFDALGRQVPIAKIWAHEETGNKLSFERDIAVRAWAGDKGIPLVEIPQSGVVRGLKNRQAWEALRDERLKQPVFPTPAGLQPCSVLIGRIPDHLQLRLGRDRRAAQPGGETHARNLLDSFLHRRGADYITARASPLTAADACSRLSPHFSYGTLSVRTAVQATQKRLKELRRMQPEEREALGGRWQQSLRAFESRLAWRDHCIQKLEMEPEIEFENFVRAFDGLRSFDQTKFDAWCAGETGYPMVDACMRYLNETGWLNFRMRAMLVSFAAYDLWLPWRKPALHLARAFLDYEPGIHYSQMQMQAGTTGSAKIRIYDPVRQGRDHDPEGVFIRRWVPKLEGVPDAFIHAPWRMPRPLQTQIGCLIGQEYPEPIVTHETAVRHARARFAAIRSYPGTEEEIQAVREKHGGDRPRLQKRKKKPPSENPNQMRLFDL